MFDEIFREMAEGFAEEFGAPFIDGQAVWQGTPVKDAGGSIITPGTPTRKSCKVQIDRASFIMAQIASYLETDVRLIVIGIDVLDSEARIEAGGVVYALLAVERDPAGIGWECHARKAS